jgi:hypothetical protein
LWLKIKLKGSEALFSISWKSSFSDSSTGAVSKSFS